jgi:hypothetical protein
MVRSNAVADQLLERIDSTRKVTLAASEVPTMNETPTTGYTGSVNALSTGLARLSQSIAEEVAAAQPGSGVSQSDTFRYTQWCAVLNQAGRTAGRRQADAF